MLVIYCQILYDLGRYEELLDFFDDFLNNMQANVSHLCHMRERMLFVTICLSNSLSRLLP